jgi:hypothetical protein
MYKETYASKIASVNANSWYGCTISSIAIYGSTAVLHQTGTKTEPPSDFVFVYGNGWDVCLGTTFRIYASFDPVGRFSANLQTGASVNYEGTAQGYLEECNYRDCDYSVGCCVATGEDIHITLNVAWTPTSEPERFTNLEITDRAGATRSTLKFSGSSVNAAADFTVTVGSLTLSANEFPYRDAKIYQATSGSMTIYQQPH